MVGAGPGRVVSLALRTRQSTSPTMTPTTSPAIPRGIHGMAESRLMSVDVWSAPFDPDPCRLRLVEERSSARLTVRAMSRVTVTVTGRVQEGWGQGIEAEGGIGT